jgi:hypothetical protein
MGIDRKPKGITARLRARKARKDALTAKDVRERVDERDGYCRYAGDAYLSGFPVPLCAGSAEWAHFAGSKRFQTRGLPPTERHTTRGSLMLCTKHHRQYDAGTLAIRALTAKGCDGPLDYRDAIAQASA